MSATKLFEILGPLMIGDELLPEDVGRVRALLEAKVDVNVTHPEGFQPLHLASGGPVEITKLLLDARADVDKHLPCHGFESIAATPLGLACGMDPPRGVCLPDTIHECCSLLIAAKADANTVDNSRWKRTPLLGAARNACPRTCSVLLEAKADVNYASPTGRTALIEAVNHCDNWSPQNPVAYEAQVIPVIELLLSAKANPFLRDERNTALEYAKARNFAKVEAILEHALTPDVVVSCSWEPATDEGWLISCVQLSGAEVMAAKAEKDASICWLRAQLSEHLNVSSWKIALVNPDGQVLSDDERFIPS